MQYRLRNKKTGQYYVPGSARKYIEPTVGKVYKNLKAVEIWPVRDIRESHERWPKHYGPMKDWEIVEFYSDEANGKARPIV